MLFARPSKCNSESNAFAEQNLLKDALGLGNVGNVNVSLTVLFKLMKL